MSLVRHLFAQCIGVGAALAAASSGIPIPFGVIGLALTQALIATLMASIFRAPNWWKLIHMCFMPAAAVAWKFDIPPGIYLAGFIALSLVYWSSFRTQVPLFLSNRATGYRLAAWIPAYGDIRLLDLGSGTGCLVAQLCELRPDWRITGIESAPAPYWWSRWSTRDLAGANLIRDDFWRHSLQTYDVVYAFLSPVPMSALWRKALKEMRPGTWLVSNSFAIDGVQESALLGVGDRRGTQLYCYQIPQRGRLAGSKRKNSRISQHLLPDDHAP